MLVVTTPATSDSASSQRKWVWVVLIMILLLGGGAYAIWQALNKAPPPAPNATPSPTPDPGPKPDKKGFLQYQGLVTNPLSFPPSSCAPSSQSGTSDQCVGACIKYFEDTCKINFPDSQAKAPSAARYSAATYNNSDNTCSCYSMNVPSPIDSPSRWCVNQSMNGTSWANYDSAACNPNE